ncbi:hypothetical protein WJX73_002708 [Symbiochloris irregularis]|uniref:Uncharacterized protein n=1 Tax=Symbiochloris irregularis TaxID=706552 RepID=A0AAW1PW25_9CHLO
MTGRGPNLDFRRRGASGRSGDLSRTRSGVHKQLSRRLAPQQEEAENAGQLLLEKATAEALSYKTTAEAISQKLKDTQDELSRKTAENVRLSEELAALKKSHSLNCASLDAFHRLGYDRVEL